MDEGQISIHAIIIGRQTSAPFAASCFTKGVCPGFEMSADMLKNVNWFAYSRRFLSVLGICLVEYCEAGYLVFL